MRALHIAPVLFISLLFFVPPSFSDETGFADLHDLRREGGKICQVGHYHYGNGSGPTKNVAMKSAISSWSNFTALEYGSDWARFYRAANRASSCTNSGSEVTCSVEARPCR